ncbi:hypothetical protein MRX96_023766 [Rhipicephalus microplus]
MFDEMSVRKSLHVRESDMALLGKVDLAEHTKPTDQVKDGDHVLVFLFRPFLGGWSQTVGAFCTSGAAPGSTVAKLILQCIVLLSNAGVIVEAVTCDNSTSNRSALNSLGVSGDVTRVSTSFEHPCDSSKVIQAIIDPPHIFKCIRNNLLKAGKFLLPGDKEVQHSHFEALLDYEEQQAGLRAVPKLTKAHISPNAFQKLSVRLAVQLFSESTASAMDFYRSREECVKLRGSKATSDFARRMNSLFDCFNSKRPQDVQYNEAEHISTLKENIEWLDRWHTYNQSLPKQKQLFFLSKPTCNALRMTLHSTVTLVEKLLNCGFRYVLVGNFGQDHLEREISGPNYRPPGHRVRPLSDGLGSLDTKLNAAYLFTNITHRQEKESFQELHSGGDKDAIAAAAKTPLVTVRTTVATPSKTALKMNAGESLSTKGNVSVYHRYAAQTDVTIVAEKQQEEGKTGSDPSGHGNATNRKRW